MNIIEEFNRVLIAIDDSEESEKAIAYGFKLANKLKATVALVHIVDYVIPASYSSDPVMGLESTIYVPEVANIQQEHSKELINKIATKYGNDVKIETFIKNGDPKHEIIKTAEEWQAGIIVMGTHGRRGLDHFISGSLSEDVTRVAPCPVMIIPNRKEK